MWDEQDRKGYINVTQQNKGQISDNDFSSDIFAYASNPQFKTFLEIGTWNGLGSTKAFADGLNTRNDDYVFYSLECNKDKSSDAAKLYSNNKKIHILNEVIWNEEPSDFYEIFPQALADAQLKHWNTVDLVNMKQCKLFLNRPALPEVFDILLLDGGEFTTYYEFQLLKNRCKILMLDDTNEDKCRKIVAELRSDPIWKIIKESRVRNGYVIAERVTV